MPTVLIKDKVVEVERDDTDSDGKPGLNTSTTSVNTSPPLGEATYVKRFWFQRTKFYDPDAVATQASLLLPLLLGNLGVRNTSEANTCLAQRVR